VTALLFYTASLVMLHDSPLAAASSKSAFVSPLLSAAIYSLNGFPAKSCTCKKPIFDDHEISGECRIGVLAPVV
jgi:hypothetical protein